MKSVGKREQKMQAIDKLLKETVCIASRNKFREMVKLRTSHKNDIYWTK